MEIIEQVRLWNSINRVHFYRAGFARKIVCIKFHLDHLKELIVTRYGSGKLILESRKNDLQIYFKR